MGKMVDLYNDMSKNNILDDKDYLNDLLEIYKKSDRPSGATKEREPRKSDFYDILSKGENKDSSIVNYGDYQRFYVMMTNNWIRNILALTEPELVYFDKNGLDAYRIIKNVLQKNPRVNSVQDIADLYNKLSLVVDPFDLNDKNYLWWHSQSTTNFDSRAAYKGDFIHVNSRYGSARNSKPIDVEYRLYIDCANEDVFKLCNLYVESCEKLGIPYYFKFQSSEKRLDKFLVYCSSEQLKNNVQILKEIAKQHPEIVKNCGPMMKLTGNIDNWIGIASEPLNSKLKCKHSFNTLRAEIFEDAAEELVLNFIEDNINKEIVVDGKKINFNKYILDVATKEILKAISKKKGPISQFSSPQFIDSIKAVLVAPYNGGKINNIRKGFKRLREVIPQKNELIATNSKAIFEIPSFDGSNFAYSIYVADKVVKAMVDVMKKCDPQYLDKYRNQIKDKCLGYHVDTSNFALNSDSLEQFKKMDSLGKTDEQKNSVFRRELDRSILDNIKLRIYNYLKANNLSNASEVMNRMNSLKGLYVENLVECGKAKMSSRGSKNEIAIDVQFVQFDANNNPIGLEPSLSQLIESQLGHELLHTGSRMIDKNGAHKSGIIVSANERGLNEGFTQLITENIFGYTVSSNSDSYTYFKKFAKILEATFGKKCVLEAYFGNSLELKNRMNAIAPNYYDNFNRYLTSAYFCKDKSDRILDLVTRDMMLNIVIPTIKKKTPEEANRYLKNIALYFVDNYQYSTDFLACLEEYMNMSEAKRIEKKGYISRDLGKESARLEFLHECQNTYNIGNIITIDNHGNVRSNMGSKSYGINGSSMLETIYAKYYEQVVVGDKQKLADYEKKIIEKLNNKDYSISFSSKMDGNVAFKRAVFAYFKKVAFSNGVKITDDIKNIGDVRQINFNVVDLKQENKFDFDSLHELVEKYEFISPVENMVKGYEIREKATKEIVKDNKLEHQAAFAHIWLGACGFKWMSGEKNHGETLAFGEFFKGVYNDMCSIVQESIKETGTINVEDLCSKLEKGRNFSDIHTAMSRMFRNSSSTKMVYQYFTSLMPKEDKKLEVEQTKHYNFDNMDYRGYIEQRINSIIPANNKYVYEELYNELAREKMKPNINNNDAYRKFVAVADGVANAISVENDVLIADGFSKLEKARKNISRVKIGGIDFDKATIDEKIQYCLAYMKQSLERRNIDEYNLYRDKYNSVINGLTSGLGMTS